MSSKIHRVAPLLILLGTIITMIVGCGDGRAPSLSGDENGSRASAEIACSSESDCRKGETCSAGVCQMKRCTDVASYAAASAPLGARAYLARQRVLVAGGTSSASSFRRSGNAFTQAASTWPVTGEIADVAGGNLLGGRAESAVIALQGDSALQVSDGDRLKSLSPGFSAAFVAVGDVDGDGLDEIAAGTEAGRVALCRAAEGKCVELNPGRSGLLDLAIADVDGDGRGEILLLGVDRISVVKASKTGREGDVVDFRAPPRLYRLTGGELANADRDEVIALQHGEGWSASDSVVRLELGGGQDGGEARLQGAAVTIDGTANDVVVDALGSREGKVVVLASGGRVDVFDGGQELRLAYSSKLGRSDVTRLGAADLSGQSAIMRVREGGGELVAGDAAPAAAVFAPPYSQAFSGGVSLAGVGATQSDSSSSSRSVAVNYGVSFGAGFEVPLGVAKIGASLSFHFGWGSSRSTTKGTSLSVGSSFWLSVDAEADDYKSGSVLLTCGCFRKYDYEVDDPAGLVPDGDKKTLRILVPVGGQSAVWSVRRYNALADQMPDKLPKLSIPFTDGKVDSYPKAPQTFDGKPIPREDLVFPKAPWLRASDSADVWFNLDSSKHESNSTARSISASASASVSLGIGPVNASVGADVGKSWDYSEEIGVSDATSFLGMIPALKDNPNTPEDEYAAHAYSFQPVVYVHHYELESGRKSGFYVLTYAARK